MYDNIEDIPETVAESKLHPTPEELFIREAIDKALMNKQKEIYYMYAYDKLTYTEMGKRLKTSKQAVAKRVQTIEKNIREWCEHHQDVYKLLKMTEGL